MNIKQILSQHRRDFFAIYECEACGATYEGRGYDDLNFHQNVIPEMKCIQCGEKAPDDYLGLAPRYNEDEQI